MASDGRLGDLTPRQREVLALVAKGRSNREIAGDIGITEDGVKAHLSRLFLRYGVTNRIELLAAAGTNPVPDRLVARSTSLGGLRAIAGRATSVVEQIGASPTGHAVSDQLATVRHALAAVDVALGLVTELPPETTGPLIEAVRKKLAAAFEALDTVQAARLS